MTTFYVFKIAVIETTGDDPAVVPSVRMAALHVVLDEALAAEGLRCPPETFRWAVQDSGYD